MYHCNEKTAHGYPDVDHIALSPPNLPSSTDTCPVPLVSEASAPFCLPPCHHLIFPLLATAQP
jgi:hypothetical protein